MKSLTDYIHAKGLKAGIYTSPGPLTCAGFTGSYEHEAQDARQYAEWGFDFLKYDWCSYGRIVAGQKGDEVLKSPYREMGEILKQQPRDIVYNLCQYGMGDVWKWGPRSADTRGGPAATWASSSTGSLKSRLKNVAIGQHNKPGEWNDPDYIQIGYIGRARGMGELGPLRHDAQRTVCVSCRCGA